MYIINRGSMRRGNVYENSGRKMKFAVLYFCTVSVLSLPKVKSMRKKRMAQSVGSGSLVTRSGYVMKARPVPLLKVNLN